MTDPQHESERRPPGSRCASSPHAPDFESFFEREYASVVGLVALLSGSRAVAEELAQDAFVSAYRRWPRVRDYDDPAAWVRRVAVNLAVSSWRRRRREWRALSRFSRSQARSVVELDRDDVQYWDAVRALPARQAQCVVLRYFEDRSIDDIATILRLAPSTVRVHLHRARSTLACRLGEVEGESHDD